MNVPLVLEAMLVDERDVYALSVIEAQASCWRQLVRLAKRNPGVRVMLTYLDEDNSALEIAGRKTLDETLAGAVHQAADRNGCRSLPPPREQMNTAPDGKRRP